MSNSSSGSRVVRDGDIVHARAHHMSPDPKTLNKTEPDTSKAEPTNARAEPDTSNAKPTKSKKFIVRKHPTVVTHGSDGDTLTIAPISSEPNQPCRPVAEVLPHSAANLMLWGHIHTNPVAISKSKVQPDKDNKKVTPDELQRIRDLQAATKAAQALKKPY